MDPASVEDVAIVAEKQADQELMLSLLENVGYRASTFENEAAFERSQTRPSAMIVCHRRSSSVQPGLPREPGCKRLVVVSDSTAEQIVVSALEAGAHYYFNISEAPRILQVRIEAALRHHSHPRQRELVVSPFRFDLEKRHVHLNEKMVNLSPKEYQFAYYLFSNYGRIVVNSELMTSVWSLPAGTDARRIDTAACRVRKKMQLNENTDWCLRRLRRVGYQLVRSVEMELA